VYNIPLIFFSWCWCGLMSR